MVFMRKNLTAESIPDLIKKMAIPVALGFFFQAMYNVTDTFYVAQLSIDALAGLSLTFPLFFLILALGIGITISTNALVSKKLGEKNEKKAVEVAAQGITISILISIAMTIIGLTFSNGIFSFMGGNSHVVEIAVQYMNIIFLGIGVLFLSATLNGILSASGDTKTGGTVMFLGFILNIFLDPALMYGWWGLPAMGVAGVAWATVLVQFLGVIIFIYRANKRGMLANSLHFYIPKKEIGFAIIKQAIPSSLNQANNAIGFLVITRFVSDFGENALATFGVGMRIDQLIVLPAIGIATASISIVGQNYGAKNFERIKETYQISLKYGIMLLLAGSVIVLAFSKQLASLFTSDPILISSISSYLWIITFSYIPTAIIIISGAVLQGLGKAHHTLGINLMRFFVIMIPSLWVMAYMMDLKETGIWFGFVVSSILMAIIAYWYTMKNIKGPTK